MCCILKTVALNCYVLFNAVTEDDLELLVKGFCKMWRS